MKASSKLINKINVQSVWIKKLI